MSSKAEARLEPKEFVRQINLVSRKNSMFAPDLAVFNADADQGLKKEGKKNTRMLCRNCNLPKMQQAENYGKA